jgi:hypothetical protein
VDVGDRFITWGSGSGRKGGMDLDVEGPDPDVGKQIQTKGTRSECKGMDPDICLLK